MVSTQFGLNYKFIKNLIFCIQFLKRNLLRSNIYIRGLQVPKVGTIFETNSMPRFHCFEGWNQLCMNNTGPWRPWTFQSYILKTVNVTWSANSAEATLPIWNALKKTTNFGTKGMILARNRVCMLSNHWTLFLCNSLFCLYMQSLNWVVNVQHNK